MFYNFISCLKKHTIYSVCHNKSSTPIIKMAKFFITDHTKNRNSNLLNISNSESIECGVIYTF